MKYVAAVLLICSASTLYGQDADSLFQAPPDSTINTAADSLSVFALIDSLLSLDEQRAPSQLGFRLGYNSNVLSNGRTLGIDNFGLSPGVSYYHHSGLFADVSAYWSKDFDPNYYLTVLSVGYMKDFNKTFGIIAGYDRYFYNTGGEDWYIPYTNALSIAPIVDIGPVTFTVNYSLYFGEQYAHRLMPSLSVALRKKKFLGLDRISLTPGFFLLYGNEAITTFDYLPPENLRELIENRRKYGTIFKPVEITRDVFGIMNYSFNLPVSMSKGNWTVMVSYAYNIPKALPGEPLTLSESSFITGSILYLLDLKRNKKPL